VLGDFIILAEMPFAELGPAVLRNEAVLRRACRTMVAPVIAHIEHALPRPDKLLGVLESAFL
jgi:hypothetical protein